MKLHNINIELKMKRDEWRKVRKEKLKRKEELLSQGLDKRVVRKDRVYKGLKKRQEYLFKNIRHIERRLNRKIASS